MTLKQKREIVKRFKAGQSIIWATSHVSPKTNQLLHIGENVIRNYLNGKFTLKPKEPSE